MTKPIWEWRISSVLLHIALIVVTFPLAVIRIYYEALRTLSINAALEWTQEWAQDPTVVLP